MNIIRIFNGLSKDSKRKVLAEWLGYGKRKNVLSIAIPEPDGTDFLINIRISERKWYCTKSKAEEHRRAMKKLVDEHKRKNHLNVTAETNICIGNYTRSVRGSGCTRIGLSRCKRGEFFFRPDKPWLSVTLSSFVNMLKSRAYNLKITLERRGITPFGIVKIHLEWLEEAVRLLRVAFSRELFSA